MDQPVHSLTFNKILQAKNYTAFILGNEKKKFAIYTSPHVGETVQKCLSSKPTPRPDTHQVLSSLLKALNITPIQLVINGMQEAIFYCRLFLEQKTEDKQEIIEIDVRPSDGLIVALSHNLPIYCTEEVLSQSASYEE